MENWATMSILIQGTIARALETHPEQITLEGDTSYVATCGLMVYLDHKVHYTRLEKHSHSLAVKAYLQERSVDGNWFK